MNATYCALIWELIEPKATQPGERRVRKIMRRRSLVTLALFGVAALAALWLPVLGLAICIACLIVYLRPEP